MDIKTKKTEAFKALLCIAQSLDNYLRTRIKTIQENIRNMFVVLDNCEEFNDGTKSEILNGLKEIDDSTQQIERRVRTFAPESGYNPTDPFVQIQEWAGTTINHEINNPLFTLRGRTQSLTYFIEKGSYTVKKTEEKLIKIEKDLERIINIMEKFLNAKNIEIISYQGNELMIDLKKL